jgi:hypothetical protein
MLETKLNTNIHNNATLIDIYSTLFQYQQIGVDYKFPHNQKMEQ